MSSNPSSVDNNSALLPDKPKPQKTCELLHSKYFPIGSDGNFSITIEQRGCFEENVLKSTYVRYIFKNNFEDAESKIVTVTGNDYEISQEYNIESKNVNTTLERYVSLVKHDKTNFF